MGVPRPARSPDRPDGRLRAPADPAMALEGARPVGPADGTDQQPQISSPGVLESTDDRCGTYLLWSRHGHTDRSAVPVRGPGAAAENRQRTFTQRAYKPSGSRRSFLAPR